MNEKLRSFLVLLACDLERLCAFMADPKKAMAEAGLSEEDQAILLSGDQNRIYAAVATIPEAPAHEASQQQQQIPGGQAIPQVAGAGRPLIPPVIEPAAQNLPPVIEPWRQYYSAVGTAILGMPMYYYYAAPGASYWGQLAYPPQIYAHQAYPPQIYTHQAYPPQIYAQQAYPPQFMTPGMWPQYWPGATPVPSGEATPRAATEAAKDPDGPQTTTPPSDAAAEPPAPPEPAAAPEPPAPVEGREPSSTRRGKKYEP